MKAPKKGTNKKKPVKKTVKDKIVKNNSAFRRAMLQMGVKSGDKVTVVFDDGSTYKVEFL